MPPLSSHELENLGSWMIERQCRAMTSYMMIKSSDSVQSAPYRPAAHVAGDDHDEGDLRL